MGDVDCPSTRRMMRRTVVMSVREREPKIMTIAELLATIDTTTNPDTLDALADAIEQRRKELARTSRPTWHVGLGVTWTESGKPKTGRIHDVRPGSKVGVRGRDGIMYRVPETALDLVDGSSS